MIRRIAIIGLLSAAVAFNSNAQDSDRVGQLEQRVEKLELRLSKLESLLSSPSKAQELSPSGEGWRSLANWRRLTSDMSASDVRQILGEPERIDGGIVARWYYPNRGEVVFVSGGVTDWKEPR